MITEVIRPLYDYSAWANQRILETSGNLSEDQFLENVGPSHGSLRNTFVHTMSGQWIWLERWQGTSPPAMMKSADFPDLASLRNRWKEIEIDTRQYLDGFPRERRAEKRQAVIAGVIRESLPLGLGELQTFPVVVARRVLGAKVDAKRLSSSAFRRRDVRLKLHRVGTGSGDLVDEGVGVAKTPVVG